MSRRRAMPDAFQLPSSSEADAEWAATTLGLPPTAFTQPAGANPRLDVLKANTSIDVEACPGSGKTTLLVAKLAILSRNWTQRRRGICVLSHTNVARRQIEEGLGTTREGRSLLTYPHFIGTIHGFVNEHLALPWLRSLDYPVRDVDDSRCAQHRRWLLARYYSLAAYVKHQEESGRTNNVVEGWRLGSPNFDIINAKGDPFLKNPSTPSAKQLRSLAKACVTDGYHRHCEMLMWGQDITAHYPVICSALRQRFPILFIDEVQDNDEDQSALLHRIFVEGRNPVVRQRFGDVNQAIYQHAGQEGATTDEFPRSSIRMDIPDSFRFGQEIATLANPLALDRQELQGRGPSTRDICSDTTNQHAVFLFEDATIGHVLPTYAMHLQKVFEEHELQEGLFTAVGAVHRPSGIDRIPRSVVNYWASYDYEFTASQPKPKTLAQYLTTGCRITNESGELFHALNMLAQGILRLARLANPSANLRQYKRSHRQVLLALQQDDEARADFLVLSKNLIDLGRQATAATWASDWTPRLKRVAEALAGASPCSDAAVDFLEWQSSAGEGENPLVSAPHRDNHYRYPAIDASVAIRVGSIHAAKGETHTATLVLETFYRTHHLKALRPWLTDRKTPKLTDGLRSRLKQHYVAMTRPTHLLCLAVREDHFIADIDKLKARWRVARATAAGPDWI